METYIFIYTWNSKLGGLGFRVQGLELSELQTRVSGALAFRVSNTVCVFKVRCNTPSAAAALAVEGLGFRA